MSYSNRPPLVSTDQFEQIHRDIHELGKDKQHIIREFTRQGLSYTEAEHVVSVAADQPNLKIALEQFSYRPYPRRPISSYHSDRPDHPGGCLALYIWFNFIISSILLIVLLFNPAALFGGNDVPGFFIILTFVVGIVDFLGLVGAWNFKKWGVYTLIGLSCLTLGLNLIASASAGGIARALFRIALLAGLVSPQWDNFE